jgi:hypothetical protein
VTVGAGESQNEVQISETPLDFSRGVLRGGRDLKQRVGAGPSGTEGDSASEIGHFELARIDGPSLKSPDGAQTCHNVTDDRARLVVDALAALVERWKRPPAREEIRSVLLRLLLELEVSK